MGEPWKVPSILYDIDEVPSDDGSPSVSPEALPPAKVQLLGLLKKKRTYLYRVYTRPRRETQAKGNSSSERWNQLAEGAMRHLVDLSIIENEIAVILKPTKKDKEKAKGNKKNLRELIAVFVDNRDSQLQIEQAQREAEPQSGKEVLSDTGSDQERGFETAEEFNQRLNQAAGLTSDEPDATEVLPETTQQRDARVHFDDEQEQEVDTVGTGQQEQIETNSQESSEDTASVDDELEILKQQLAMKNYQEKVLTEQLAIKETELAKVDLHNRQLAHKLDKEKNENLKLSVELKKWSVAIASANSDPNARPPLQTLASNTGTIPRFSFSGNKDQQSEKSRSDREVRRSWLQPDLSYDFQSRQGDYVTSSPAYTGLTRGAAGRGVTGDQPPDDCDPSRPFQSGPGAARTPDGGDLSAQVDLHYPWAPLKDLTRYQLSKFSGKESQYDYWKLQFQASYGSQNISTRDKTLFLLSLLEGEPNTLCAGFVRHNIDDTTYTTLWEVLDR